MERTMRKPHWQLAIVTVLIAMLCTTAYAAKDKKKAKRPAATKTSPAAESERKVTENQVPAPALKTLKQLARKAEITEFSEEIEHGSTFYEGSWKTKAGTNVDVLVTKAGALVEIEEQIPPKKLPAAALRAAQKLAGKDAEVACEQKTMILYEIKFTKDGASHEVLLTPDGRVAEQEIEKGKSDDGDEDGNKVKNSDDEDRDNEEKGDNEKDRDGDQEEENGQKVSFNDVPKAVQATIRKNLDGGKIEDIEQIGSGKKTIYETDIIINGKEVELRVGTEGQVLSKKVETDEDGDDEEKGDNQKDRDSDEDQENGRKISVKDVPQAVRATVRKHLDGGKIEDIERIGGGKKVIYEVDIIINGKEVELRVGIDGQVLSKKIESDEDGDKKGDDDNDRDQDDDK